MPNNAQQTMNPGTGAIVPASIPPIIPKNKTRTPQMAVCGVFKLEFVVMLYIFNNAL